MKRIIFIGILVSVFAFSGLAFAVPPPPGVIHVYVDVKPQSCPNPFNFGSKGVLPVAILGTEDFDVTQIDPASILLAGASPLRWSYEDVSSPVNGIDDGECPICSEAGPDGNLDLTLKFKTQEILIGDSLDSVELTILNLIGFLKEEFGGTPIRGADCVVVVGSQYNGVVEIESIDRVTICHIPPGNPAAYRTLAIGARGLPAHLAHGDFLGPCTPD